MHRAKSSLIFALLFLALGQTAEAGWLKLAHSVYQATKKSEAHPATATTALVVPRDLEKDVLLCVSYTNSLEEAGKGKVKAWASFETIVDGEVVVEKVKLVAQVNRNRAQRCKAAGPFKQDDVIHFDFEFVNFPDMDGKKNPADWMVAIGAVSTNGPNEPLLFRQGKKVDKNAPGEGWIQVQDTVFQAENKNVRHPKSVIGALRVGRNLKEDTALLCMDYTNFLPNHGQGRVKALAEYETGEVDEDGNPVMARVKWNRNVKKNHAGGCKEISNQTKAKKSVLREGSVIVFQFDFSGFKNLRGGAHVHDWLVASMALSTNGETRSLLFQQPEDEDDGGGNGGGGGGNGGGGGGNGGGGDPGNTNPPAGSQISEADQRQVSKLFKNTKVQLWRPKGDNPGHWVVVGPKTRAIEGNKLNYNTAGVGSTINQAVADYERKQGSLGPTGGLLTAHEVERLNWYSRMNSGGGPTSIRRDGGGGFHAEFYRPGRGSVVQAVGSMAAAIDFFQKNGL